WGITGGTVAGMVLADALTGRDNPWAELFDATRQPGAAENRGQPPLRKEDMPEPRQGPLEQLRNGEAAIFQDGESEERVAAYRDDAGELHLVRASCTSSRPSAPISAARWSGTTAIAPGTAPATAPRSSPTAP